MGHMGDEQHTVPRSEIAALQAVCCRACPEGPPIECWSDCKYVVDTFASLMGPQGVDCASVKHGSLWEEIRAKSGGGRAPHHCPVVHSSHGFF